MAFSKYSASLGENKLASLLHSFFGSSDVLITPKEWTPTDEGCLALLGLSSSCLRSALRSSSSKVRFSSNVLSWSLSFMDWLSILMTMEVSFSCHRSE